MSAVELEYLLWLVVYEIQKQNTVLRQSIAASERLTVGLHFLPTDSKSMLVTGIFFKLIAQLCYSGCVSAFYFQICLICHQLIYCLITYVYDI